jgi:hypothetical protein
MAALVTVDVTSDESMRAGAGCGSGFLAVVLVLRVVFFLDLLWASAVPKDPTRPINTRLQTSL